MKTETFGLVVFGVGVFLLFVGVEVAGAIIAIIGLIMSLKPKKKPKGD